MALRILIVDDSPEDRAVYRRLLGRQERQEYDVTEADCGEDGLEICQSELPDCILLDYNLPDLDGLEFLTEIGDAVGEHPIAIVMLTGQGNESVAVEAMKKGAQDYLVKDDVTSDNLQRAVSNAVEKVSLQRKVEQQREELKQRNYQLQQANARMQRDLEAAAKIQQSLLPTELPDVPSAKLAWTYLPCDELAGDCLNIFPLDDRHLALLVVDVSGHGVASSLLSVTIGRVMTPQVSSSSLLVRSIEASTKPCIVPPLEVALELNKRFPMEDQGGLYFTMVYGVLDLETNEFRFVAAGHPPVVHVRRGQDPELIEADGMAIGWFEDIDVEEHAIQLQPGDRLYLYSDGIPEAMDKDLNEFGSDRMLAAINRSNTDSLDDSVANLMAEISRWCSDHPKDDIAVIAMEILLS